MSQRLKLVIAYDGASFAGWQSQAHRNTIQDHLERAFQKITGHSLRVHGAGRTDAGVHALGQCAHVDVENKLTETRWRSALNSCLPAQVRILRCQTVPSDFHARFSAQGKIYRYRLWTGTVLPPLEDKRMWHLPSAPDLEVMRSATAQFVGKHDFAGFAANRGRPNTDTKRTIHFGKVSRRGSSWTIEFNGDGFLYKMVRLMVGAAVGCAIGKMGIAELRERLQSPRTEGPRLAAPSEGLYLIRIRY